MSRTIEEIKKEIADLNQEDYERSMSDDFWYSNGGHDRILRQLSALRKELESLGGNH